MKALFLFLLLACSCFGQTFTFNDLPFLASSQDAPTISVTVTSKFILDVSGTAPWDVEVNNPSGEIGSGSYPAAGTYTLCILTNSEVTHLYLDDEDNLETLTCTGNQSLGLLSMDCSAGGNFAMDTAPDLSSNTNLAGINFIKLNEWDDESFPLVQTNQNISIYMEQCSESSANTFDFGHYPKCSSLTAINCGINDFANIAASYTCLTFDLSANSSTSQADCDALLDAIIAGEQTGGTVKVSGNITVAKGNTLVADGWEVEALNYPPP